MKGIRFFAFIFIVIILLAAGSVAWWYKQQQDSAKQPAPEQQAAVQEVKTEPEGEQRVEGFDARVLVYDNGFVNGKFDETKPDVITIVDAFSGERVAKIETKITPKLRGSQNAYTLVGEHIYFFNQADRMIERLDFSGNVTKLSFTQLPADRFYPYFLVSPDEKSIAWSRAARGGTEKNPTMRSAMWSAGIDGSGQTLLVEKEFTGEVHFEPYRWSKDFATIYFSEQPGGRGGYILFDGPHKLFSVRIADKKVSEIAYAQNPGFALDITSDGSKLAYTKAVSDQTSPAQVLIKNIASDNEQSIGVPLNVLLRSAGSGFFSPDDEQFAFTLARQNPDDEAFYVAVAPAAGGDAKVLDVDPKKQFRVMGWASNKRLIVKSEAEQQSWYTVYIDDGKLVPFEGAEAALK